MKLSVTILLSILCAISQAAPIPITVSSALLSKPVIGLSSAALGSASTAAFLKAHQAAKGRANYDAVLAKNRQTRETSFGFADFHVDPKTGAVKAGPNPLNGKSTWIGWGDDFSEARHQDLWKGLKQAYLNGDDIGKIVKDASGANDPNRTEWMKARGDATANRIMDYCGCYLLIKLNF